MKKKNECEEVLYSIEEIFDTLFPSKKETEEIIEKLEKNKKLTALENFKVNNYLLYRKLIEMRNNKL